MVCQCEFCDLKMLFFNCIGDDEVEKYCESRTETPFKEGAQIIVQGEPISEFLYLKEGLVKLFRTNENGEEQIISIGKPYDFVSILSVFSTDRYNYSVTALSPSVICSFKLSQITDLIRSNGLFALNLIQTLTKSSDRIIINTMGLLQKRLYGRLAYLLLYFADEVFHKDEYELPLSRKEISQYIGMTQENVIRAISSLRKDGTIKVFGKLISIEDKVRLKRMNELS